MSRRGGNAVFAFLSGEGSLRKVCVDEVKPLLCAGNEAVRRASSATMKPKAAAVAPVSGMTSCKAPQANPPWGRH